MWSCCSRNAVCTRNKGCSESNMCCLGISKSGQLRLDLIQSSPQTFCYLWESEAPQISLHSWVFSQLTRSKGLNFRGAQLLVPLSSISSSMLPCSQVPEQHLQTGIFTWGHISRGWRVMLLGCCSACSSSDSNKQQQLQREAPNELHLLLSRTVPASRRCITDRLGLYCYYFVIVK